LNRKLLMQKMVPIMVQAGDALPLTEENGDARAVTNVDMPAGEAVIVGTTKRHRMAQKDLICNNCQVQGHGTWRNHICMKHEEYLAQHGKW